MAFWREEAVAFLSRLCTSKRTLLHVVLYRQNCIKDKIIWANLWVAKPSGRRAIKRGLMISIELQFQFPEKSLTRFMRTLSSNQMQLVSVRRALSNQCSKRFITMGGETESSLLAVFYLGSAKSIPLQKVLAGKTINFNSNFL